MYNLERLDCRTISVLDLGRTYWLHVTFSYKNCSLRYMTVAALLLWSQVLESRWGHLHSSLVFVVCSARIGLCDELIILQMSPPGLFCNIKYRSNGMWSNWRLFWEFGFKTRVQYNAPLKDQQIHRCVMSRKFAAAEMCSFAWQGSYERWNEQKSDWILDTYFQLLASVYREGCGITATNFVPDVS